EVAELAAALGVALSGRARDRLHRHTAGHPLYVRMLLSEVAPEELRAPEGELPVPRSLAAATVGRLADLSSAARDLAAALAVMNQRVPLATLGSVAAIPASAAALEELLATGLVTWAPGEPGCPVAFAHPLYRAAIYQDLAPTRRRRLHLAAAGHADRDGALAHRVSAADRPDAGLADELEAAAAGARQRQLPALAARYLSWASGLSPGQEARERRLLQAARTLLADDRADAEDLRPRLERCAGSCLRDLVLGKLAWRRGDPAGAEQLLRAAAAGPDTGIAAEALVDLALHYAIQSRGHAALAAADTAVMLPGLEPGLAGFATALRALGIAQVEGAVKGLDALIPHLPGPAEEILPADAGQLLIRGMLRFFAGQAGRAVGDLRALVSLARHGAVPRELPRAHLHLAQALIVTGQWDEALVHAHVALDLVTDEGQWWHAPRAHGVAATVTAARGAWQAAEAHCRAARETAGQAGTLEGRYAAALAAAALCHARGDHAGVVAALSPLTGGNDGAAIPMFTALTWWPTLIGSLIETGDVATATEQAGHLAAAAAARSLDLRARLAGLHGRLAAATGQPEAATAAFAQATTQADPDEPLLDRAEDRHHYGRLLRARGDRQGAIAQLRCARGLLEPVGARPYLDRIDADLDRCGISAEAGSPGSPLALTDREQDVAALAARGLTNREVAATLYISAKAVEYHLGN
ncbi:MAG: helix-turn-helix transcriptional regulator, partial [Actinobacteria bacterium]|nr:helix-turn-helix transcriptional regulator [Actinomycetota bacterium]